MAGRSRYTSETVPWQKPQPARTKRSKRGRAAQRYAAEVEKALERPARNLMAELDGQVRIAIQTALAAAGYRRHGGQWRKRRAKADEKTNETGICTEGK